MALHTIGPPPHADPGDPVPDEGGTGDGVEPPGSAGVSLEGGAAGDATTAACVIVTVLSATLKVPLRGSERVLFSTLYLIVPDPMPPVSTRLMKSASLHALHPQSGGAVTVTVPENWSAEILFPSGETE